MQRCPGRRKEAGAYAGHKESAPASAEKNWRLPLRARSARLREPHKTEGANRRIGAAERNAPREIERSSRPSALSRTPRLRDASRRPSIDRSAPTTADARDEPSIAAASASIPRRPPAAHDALCNRTAHGARRDRRPSTSAPRTDRGAHRREPAFSETATRLPPRQRARHRQRRGRARRARAPRPALAFATSHAGLRLPPAVEPSRRPHRRDWPPTAPRDRGEGKCDALPKGHPARTAGIERRPPLRTPASS